MLDEVGVVEVRRFNITQMILGVGKDDDSFFVYDRPFGSNEWAWRIHCGPYSTRQQAVDWIRDIRETQADYAG